MSLNCPQNGEHLRLSSAGHRPPSRARRSHGKTLLVAIELLVVVAIIAGGAYAFLYGTQLMSGQPHSSADSTQAQAAKHATGTQQTIAQTKPETPKPVPFCQRDFSNVEARRQDIAELKAAGGLVHLLAREQAKAPFKCATFYLAHGLNINATAPNGLTPLHFAIKANRPEMVRFVIARGANLHKKAGKKQLEPMSYAYYLAFNNPEINRNPIIAILNSALNDESRRNPPADAQ